MSVLLPIGVFSRMTYLSINALRHYYEIGLLLSAVVDSGTGYRLYEPQQVRTAQVHSTASRPGYASRAYPSGVGSSRYCIAQ
jgi:DNA-binding transcriptional MerR regulator